MIHKFSLYGTNMVIDVNSGAVHIFDDISYKALDLYKKCGRNDIVNVLSCEYPPVRVNEAINEISDLERRGLLYSEDLYADQSLLYGKNSCLKAMCLNVSHDCNMRCRYCFASTGDFGTGRELMSAETGKKAIDFLIRESGVRRNLEIDFFGGEPLLNFSAVKELVQYARSREKEASKNFRFTITTNAMTLNENHRSFINKYFDNVVLSIDGREETNDRMRIKEDGTGTYGHVLPAIKEMAESRNQDNYYVRGTYTRNNPDFSEDVLHLADEGFRQISVEPVVAAMGTGFEIREEDLPALCKEYEILADEYVKRKKGNNGFNFFHFMLDLEQGPCAAKRLKGCGSGREYVAVIPGGDIYPCHQFVGMEAFKMGNVSDNALDTGIRELFRNSNIYTKTECSTCWAKFYCSGGCAANAFQFNRDINIPYKIGCELEKKRVECAFWIKTQT